MPRQRGKTFGDGHRDVANRLFSWIALKSRRNSKDMKTVEPLGSGGLNPPLSNIQLAAAKEINHFPVSFRLLPGYTFVKARITVYSKEHSTGFLPRQMSVDSMKAGKLGNFILKLWRGPIW